jgi:hypothetical protein
MVNMPESRGIITIAIGEKYAKQAKSLACSCMLHSPWTIRAVITDRTELLAPYYDIIIPYKAGYGQPFSLKTQLYKFSPFNETAYIDADSLLISELDSLWGFLDSRSFVYEGKTYTTGFWYYDIAQVMEWLNVPWIPKFNSGMFLFKKDEAAQSIFDTAHRLMSEGSVFTVDFFREKMLPDEPYLAAALALKGEMPLTKDDEHGRFSYTLINAKHIRLNVIRGFAAFVKDGTPVFPLVVHFCGRLGRVFYMRERIRLFLCFNPPVYTLAASLFSLAGRLLRHFTRKKADG